ncbi:MAG: hypothetical protein Kow0058_01560 [Roseovarius sp.]
MALPVGRRGQAAGGALPGRWALTGRDATGIGHNLPLGGLYEGAHLAYERRTHPLERPPAMPAEIAIRPVAATDRAPWAALWRAYLEFYETSVGETVYDATFARLCDPEARDQCGLLAEIDGRAAGLVHYIFHPHNWRIEKVCYLQDLYVDPSARGRGVGRALMEAVFAAADAAGCPSVYWLTQDFNAPARRLYDRIGILTPFIKYARR